MTWQPIFTAPKDGTDVLLFYPDYRRKVHVGYFIDTERFEHGKSTYRHQGWSIGQMVLLGFNDKSEPSHWMPIPATPEKERVA